MLNVSKWTVKLSRVGGVEWNETQQIFLRTVVLGSTHVLPNVIPS